MSHYKLLGIQKTASTAEIKKAYRKLALKYHPDKNPNPKARDKFMKITEAYDVLCDPIARRRYDLKFKPPRRSSSNSKTTQKSTYAQTQSAYQEWSEVIKGKKKRPTESRTRPRYRQSNDQFTKKDAKDLGIHGLGCLITFMIMVGAVAVIAFLDTQFSWFPTVILILAALAFLPVSGYLFYSILDYLRKKL